MLVCSPKPKIISFLIVTSPRGGFCSDRVSHGHPMNSLSSLVHLDFISACSQTPSLSSSYHAAVALSAQALTQRGQRTIPGPETTAPFSPTAGLCPFPVGEGSLKSGLLKSTALHKPFPAIIYPPLSLAWLLLGGRSTNVHQGFNCKQVL